MAIDFTQPEPEKGKGKGKLTNLFFKGETVVKEGTDGPYAWSGMADARFMGYTEIGVHRGRKGDDGNYKPDCDWVLLTWVLVDCTHDFGGEIGVMPITHTEWVNVSMFENGYFKKYAYAMREAEGCGDATNFLDFLGAPMLLDILTKKGKKNGEDWMYMNLKPAGVLPAAEERRDRKTKKMVREYFDVTEYDGPFYKFVWDSPTLEDFNGLPKWMQGLIQKSKRFDGSPVQAMLLEAGVIGTEERKAAERTADANEATAAADGMKGMDDCPF